MKKGIHPDYHTITVVMTDGEKFDVRSAYGSAGDTLNLDIDVKIHPAWKKDKKGYVNTKNSKVEKFNQRFAGLDFASISKTKKPTEDEKSNEVVEG